MRLLIVVEGEIIVWLLLGGHVREHGEVGMLLLGGQIGDGGEVTVLLIMLTVTSECTARSLCCFF